MASPNKYTKKVDSRQLKKKSKKAFKRAISLLGKAIIVLLLVLLVASVVLLPLISVF